MESFGYSQIISKDALIGDNCIMGNNVVVEEGVTVGSGAYIGHNVVIHKNVAIGDNAYIDDNTVLGRIPKTGFSVRRKAAPEFGPLTIGDDCVIGVGAIVYMGTRIGNESVTGDLA